MCSLSAESVTIGGYVAALQITAEYWSTQSWMKQLKQLGQSTGKPFNDCFAGSIVRLRSNGMPARLAATAVLVSPPDMKPSVAKAVRSTSSLRNSSIRRPEGQYRSHREGDAIVGLRRHNLAAERLQ
jgi:hypothetical protein